MGRILSNLARIAPPDGSPVDSVHRDERQLRIEVEQFLGETSVAGGLILGRGATFVLRNAVPGVLCVLLTTPRGARVEQAMRIDDVDRRTRKRATAQRRRYRSSPASGTTRVSGSAAQAVGST
jgi:hypothetical protein